MVLFQLLLHPSQIAPKYIDLVINYQEFIALILPVQETFAKQLKSIVKMVGLTFSGEDWKLV